MQSRNVKQSKEREKVGPREKWFQKETLRSLRRLMGKKVKHPKERRGGGATGEPVPEKKLAKTGWTVYSARC